MDIDYKNDNWKVLVVDDVQVHRFLMVSGLERLNPLLAVTDAESIDAAKELLSAGKFDVVVSDWNMPGGGGGELVKWMRARPHFQHVPFVMISGKSENEDIIEAFMQLGVDAYVVKPFEATDLYSKIRSSIDKRKA